MGVQMLSAFLLAFLITLLFGKGFIPWLKKKEITQPLKAEVKEKIYADKAEEGESS